jgi:hypothetical protein
MRGLTAFLIAFFFADDIDICDTQKMTQTRKGTKKSNQAVPRSISMVILKPIPISKVSGSSTRSSENKSPDFAF